MSRAILDKHTIICVVEAMSDAARLGVTSGQMVHLNAAEGLKDGTIDCRCLDKEKPS